MAVMYGKLATCRQIQMSFRDKQMSRCESWEKHQATFLISLIKCTFASHVYSRTVYFIADAIFLLLQCSASHTHTLCLSTFLLSFPFFPFDINDIDTEGLCYKLFYGCNGRESAINRALQVSIPIKSWWLLLFMKK